MSIVRPRSRSSDSPDYTGWRNVRGRFNVIDGNSDEDLDFCQFRRTGRRGDSLPTTLESTPGHYYPLVSSSSSSHSDDLASGSPPKFAMTPAEFHLFPSARSTGNTINFQNTEMERQEECLGVGHLTTLRSAAFWELRRSVIENGEGLIRRMRDYEQSRLHQQVRRRAKERSKKRGHCKSSTLRSRCKARTSVSEASDDDVLICSEDTSQNSWSPLATRSKSLDPMDVDGDDLDAPVGRRGSRSMPGADYSQDQPRYNESMLFTGTFLRTEKEEAGSESLLCYPESASPTPSSSSISLPLPQSLSTTADRSPKTPSEKALAELNVAFANGACSITDYSPIWTYQQQFHTDEHDSACHNHLWR